MEALVFNKELNKPHRIIKDIIHDQIPISSIMTRFIDTKQFQRLRYIKQLGTTSYVWPSATHSRFEHCLGVAYLARLMVYHLKDNQPELDITERDVGCVELAGLCHDLGHGPWSHVWDGMFMPKALPNIKWKHEVGSEMMFDALVSENEIALSKEDQNFIKALISGEHSRTPDEKPFLFDIVANKRNGLDVDKIDYIQRDSLMIGEDINIAPLRLVHSARVNNDQISYNIKDANLIYEICAARFKMHKMIYNHKTAKAIEYMIIDALLAAEPHEKIAKRVFDPREYLWLTDDIMQRIQSSKEPALAEARAIFDRISTRDLYRCVDYKVLDWPLHHIISEHITAEKIVDAALGLPPGTSIVDNVPGAISTSDSMDSFTSSSSVNQLAVSDVIVDLSPMHYGMKEKNPLDSVMFYHKNDPNKCYPASRGDYSNLMPAYFTEDLLRVYTKKPQFYGLIQAGYRAVLATLDDYGQKLLDQKIPDSQIDTEGLGPVITDGESLKGFMKNTAGFDTGTVVEAPTPPETEAPSTPKTHSRNTSFSFGSSASDLGTALKGSIGPNNFTTVPPNYAPPSPTRGGPKTRKGSGKGGSKPGDKETATSRSVSTGAGEISILGGKLSRNATTKRRRDEENNEGPAYGDGGPAATKKRK